MNAPSTPPVRHPLVLFSVCDNMFASCSNSKNHEMSGGTGPQRLYGFSPTYCGLTSVVKLMISFASPSMLFSTTRTARNKLVSVFCVDYSSASKAGFPTRNHIYVYGYKTLSQARWASTAPQVSQSAQVSHKTVWSAHNLQHTCFIYYSTVKLSQTNVIFCKSTNTHT